jgi:tRNA dimethylallyltransferase
MKKNIPCILGPTGSGKTFLAIELAKRFPVEIISVDSRQVYRGMDIGTAKPPKSVLEQYPHHLIDIRNPDEQFNAGEFVELSVAIVDEILSRKHIPLFVGGTGMYIYALENGLFQVETDPEIREQLKNELEIKGLSALYKELCSVDPESANRLHPNDKQRILRALEIYRTTGKSISYWRKEATRSPFLYSLEKFILFPDRSFLYPIINERVIEMVNAGLIEEVRTLLRKGYTEHSPGMRSVGYQESIRYIKGDLTQPEMIAEIQKNTRRYAKRQYTWFKKHGGQFIPFSSKRELMTVVDTISQWMEKLWKEII